MCCDMRVASVLLWLIFAASIHTSFYVSLTHSSWCVCVCERVDIQGALIAFFVFLIPDLFVLWSLFLSLCTWPTRSKCLHPWAAQGCGSKQRGPLSQFKKRTAISGGVSLNDSQHIWVTCSVAGSFHPASQRRTKEYHRRPLSVQSHRQTGDKINNSPEWNYCRLWAAFLTLLFWNTANVSPCLLPVLDWYLLLQRWRWLSVLTLCLSQK